MTCGCKVEDIGGGAPLPEADLGMTSDCIGEKRRKLRSFSPAELWKGSSHAAIMPVSPRVRVAQEQMNEDSRWQVTGAGSLSGLRRSGT